MNKGAGIFDSLTPPFIGWEPGSPAAAGVIDVSSGDLIEASLNGEAFASLSFGQVGVASSSHAATLTLTLEVVEDRRHWDVAAGGTIQTGNGSQWVEQAAPGTPSYAVFNKQTPRNLALSLGADLTWRGLIVDGETLNLDLDGHSLELTTAGNSLKEYNILVGEGRNGTSRLTLHNGDVAAAAAVFVGFDAGSVTGENPAELIVGAGGRVVTRSSIEVAGGNRTDGKLTIRDGGTVDGQRLDVAKTFGAVGEVVVQGASSTLQINGAGSSIGLRGRGEVTMQDGATVQWHASLVEVGSLSGHFSRLRIEGVGTTSRGGSFGIGSGAQMEVRGGADLQSPVGGVVTRALGRYQMENATGMLETFDVIGGDAFITHGSVLTVAQVVMEGGLLQITDPASKLLGVDNFRIDSGTLDVLAGAVLSVDSFLMSAGRVLVSGSGSKITSSQTCTIETGIIELSQGAVLEGNEFFLRSGANWAGNGGTLRFNQVFNTSGYVLPGNSPGTLTIDGNYVQGGAGTLELEIGGLGAGTEYDQFIVTGNATIDGTVKFSFINGFAPQAGQTFNLVNVGGTLGGTPVIEVVGLETDWQFSTTMSAGILTLTSENNGRSTQRVTNIEDTATSFVLTPSNPGPAPLAFVVTVNPAHGTLSGIAPNLTYSPGTNYHGPDFFKYRMTDNNGVESIELTVNITITPVNDLPVLGFDSGIVTVGEGGTATNTGFFFDQDDAVTLTASIGSLTRNDGAGTWAWSLDTTDGPESDTVTITANDRSGAATNFTFTLEITNLAPAALAQTLTTPSNTPISLILRATDPGADTLTYTVTENPVHGTLSGAVPHLTYTPGTNYVGTDSFQFAAIDSDGAISAPATVSISVIPTNTPVAAAGTIRQSGADFIVTFFGLPGSDYRVQFTSDLSSPAVWNEFAPPAIFTASPSGAFSHTNVTPPGPFRFYRAIPHLDHPLR